MTIQEQINALRFRIEQIKAKFSEQHNPNRSEIPNTHEPDPYEVDWSKAPDWADSHFYNRDVGHWGGLEYNIHGYYLWLEPSGFTLSKELDWKQSKRRRPQ